MREQGAGFLRLYDVVQSIKVTNHGLCILVIQEFRCEIGVLMWKLNVYLSSSLLRTLGILQFINFLACGVVAVASTALS